MFKQKRPTSKYLLVFILLLVFSLLVGCDSAEVSEYKKQITELNNQWNVIGERVEKSVEKSEEDFSKLEENANTLMEASPSPSNIAEVSTTIDQMMQILSIFANEIQGFTNELNTIYNTMETITPPEQFESEHSMYKLAMIQMITPMEVLINELNTFISNPNEFNLQSIEKSEKRMIKTLDEGEENFAKADAGVFGTFPWGTVYFVGVILLMIGVIVVVVRILKKHEQSSEIHSVGVSTKKSNSPTCQWCGTPINTNFPYCNGCGRVVN